MESSYQQYRKLNLKGLQKDQAKNLNNYHQYVGDFKLHFGNLHEKIIYLIENKSQILEKLYDLNELKKSAEYFKTEKGHQELVEKFYLGWKFVNPQVIKSSGNPDSMIAKNLKAYIKDGFKKLTKKIEKLENELSIPFTEIQHSGKRLLNLNVHKQLNFITDEKRQSANNYLNDITSSTFLKHFNDIPEVIESLKVKYLDALADLSNEYLDLLSTHKPKLSKNIISKYAKDNINYLIRERDIVGREFAEKLKTLEGLVLSFATYELESKKQTSRDKAYTDFLSTQANNKLAKLKGSNLENICTELDKLHMNGSLLFDEYLFLKAKIEKEFTISAGQTEGKLLEDSEYTQLIFEILSGKYGLSQEQSTQMAQVVSGDQLDNFENTFNSKLGSEISRKLINENPSLMLLDQSQSEAFIGLFTELSKLSQAVNRPDYDPFINPDKYANFRSLRSASSDLYSILGVGGRPQIREIRPRISEFDAIKIQLARDGLDPDMTMDILTNGFRYGRDVFVGDHKLSYDNLRENTARGNPDFDDKTFKRTLNKLGIKKAILSSRGYSRNPHLNEIVNDSLREAVRYSSTHPHQAGNNHQT